MSKSKLWLVLFFGIYVGLFILISAWSHPVLWDDYGHFQSFKNYGFMGAQIYAWENFTSRFTTFFIINLGYALGIMEHYYIWPMLVIMFSLVSIYVLVSTLRPKESVFEKLFLTLLSQVVLFSVSIGLNETLYWYAGTPYFYTVSFLLLELALVVRLAEGNNPLLYFSLCALLILLNSGISELTAAYQVPIFAVAVIFTWLSGKKQATKYMAILLVVAFAGLAIQALNQGNIIRSEGFRTRGEQPRNIGNALKFALLAGSVTALKFFSSPIIYALWLFLPLAWECVKAPEFIKRLPFRLKLWHIFTFQIMTVFGFHAIGGWSTGTGLPVRAQGLVICIMTLQWIFLFLLCYRSEKFAYKIKKSWFFKHRAAVLVLCLALSLNFIAVINDCFVGHEYSGQLNERYRYIKEQKELKNLNLIVPSTIKPKLLFAGDIVGFAPYDNSSQFEETQRDPYCAYFGINSIRMALPQALQAARAGNYEEELSIITNLAHEGDAEAQYILFELYSAEDNKIEALKWIIKAAENGYPSAPQIARSKLRRGWGTANGKPDYIAAIKWYLKGIFWVLYPSNGT